MFLRTLLPKRSVAPLATTATCLLFLLSAGISGSLSAQEETEFTTRSNASYRYGQTMEFSLRASANTDIEKVSLFISAPDLRRTLTTDVAVVPGKVVEATYRLDLTTVRLAPFTRVTYWWEVWDANDPIGTSEKLTLEYEDDQFEWNTFEENGIHVHTTAGDSDLSQTAMDISQETLPRIRAIIPANAPDPLHIYLYPSEGDLRSALRLTGREWIGSHAHPELGVILVPAPEKETAVDDLERTLPHELAHLLLFQALGEAYGEAPGWFDEGLATSFEKTDVAAREKMLSESVVSEVIIPLSELCHVFPDEGGQFSLAYAESASLIEYVSEEYGSQALTDMILALADGAGCQDLTEEALGISLTQLEDEWRRRQAPEFALAQIWRQGAVFLIIIVSFGILVLLLVARSPRNARDDDG